LRKIWDSQRSSLQILRGLRPIAGNFGNLQASRSRLQRRSNLQSSTSKGRSVIRVMLKSVMVELEVVSLELLWMLEVGI
jgi:hypothetical protein